MPQRVSRGPGVGVFAPATIPLVSTAGAGVLSVGARLLPYRPDWRRVGVLCLWLLGCSEQPRPDGQIEPAAYVGSAECAQCHAQQFDAWQGSHHQSTMAPPTATRVPGDFAAESSVGCEACHGPGSAHVANPGGSRLPPLQDAATQVNACAPCHSRRQQLARGFTPTRDYLDHYLPALLDAGLYHPDGQVRGEVHVYGSFLQSKKHAAGVTCGQCHDPHAATLHSTGNDLCTRCHNPAGNLEFATVAAGTYDSAEHHFHDAGSPGAQCVNCHMLQQSDLGVDQRADHRFHIPRPDLTISLGVPNACDGCHADRDAQWAAAQVADWWGTASSDFAETFARARTGDSRVEAALVAVAADGNRAAIVRATALALLANYRRGVSAVAVREALHDPAPLVRLGALRGAQRWPAPVRFARSKHLLDDPLLAVRHEAARVLSEAFGGLSGGARRQLDRGLAEYLHALRLHADRAEAHTQMAAVHLHKGDNERAEAALQHALALDPQWIPALVNLADLYRASGRDAQAGPLLATALELAPEQPGVLVAYGFWLVRQGRAAEALPRFVQAAAQAPYNTHHGRVLAAALHAAGQSERGLQELERLLVHYPRDEELLRAAFGIARDAGLEKATGEYLRRLELRWSR